MAQPYRVRGLDEALDTLKKIDPELYKAAQKRIKGDAKPMITEARNGVPQQSPLSRWKESSGAGQRSGEARLPAWSGRPANRINASVRRRKIRGTGGKRTLMKMQQTSPAGAVFDIAGRKNPGGSQFNRNLIAKYGPASRSMWPAAEKHLSTVQKSIEKSVSEMERILNTELRTRGPR
jgi:hypothetical protein